MEVLNSIGDIFRANLRRLRGNRTQSDVAESARLPLRTYQRYEDGQIPIKKTAHQAAIAAALGVPVGRLFVDPDLVPKPTTNDVLKLARMGLAVAENLPQDVLERLAEMGPADVAWLRGALSGRDPGPHDGEREDE